MISRFDCGSTINPTIKLRIDNVFNLITDSIFKIFTKANLIL